MKFRLYFLGAFLFLLACNQERIQTKATYAALTEAVYTSVSINAKDMYEGYSPIVGIVETVYVEEGDRVKVGDPILKIKDWSAKYHTRSAELNVELARNNINGQYDLLAEIQSDLSIARNQLRNDSILYLRQQNLWQKGVGSKNELEQRELKFFNAKDRFQALNNKYQRTKKQLEIQLAQSKIALQDAKENAGDFVVKSRIDGIVYSLFMKTGELVNPQVPVCEIGSADEFVIEMEVDETDISKVKINQRIWLTLEAFGDQVLEARLTRIFPKMNEQTQSFKVEGEFIKPPSPLYPGLTGESNIVIEEHPTVLVLPKEYLTEESQVETEEGMVSIQTGLQNEQYIEVLAGIDTSTIVLYPIP